MRFPNSFNFLIFVLQGLTVQKKTAEDPMCPLESDETQLILVISKEK